MTTPDCKTCGFARSAEGQQKWVELYEGLVCRRRAPVLLSLGTNDYTGWPSVQDDDWCGEHAIRVHTPIVVE